MNTIGIIGLGYVGLPLLLRYADVGYKVIGFDIDPSKIEHFNAKHSYINHIKSEHIASAIEKGAEVTTDFSKISSVDAIIICVPTPLNKYRDPDLSFILNTMEVILPYIVKGQVISLESTTYPGTTEEEIVPRVEEKGFTVGQDYFVVFSPEREDPGNKDYTTATIPKVVGGHTVKCLEKGIELYSKVINRVVPVSSTKVAEMTKLLENIHRSINIGLVNEMKIIADKMGIDIFEVIDAASTKPFGFTPYYPGPGLGGHCIPIDPFYLTWKAKGYGLHTRFIELSGEINRDMPFWVVEKIVHGLNVNKKSVNGSKVLVIGIAYKKNVDDMRESPSVAVMEILRDLGAELYYHDDFVPHFPKMREHNFDLSSVPLNNLEQYDCVALLTDHDYIDYDNMLTHANLLVDSRGRYRRMSLEKLIKA